MILHNTWRCRETEYNNNVYVPNIRTEQPPCLTLYWNWDRFGWVVSQTVIFLSITDISAKNCHRETLKKMNENWINKLTDPHKSGKNLWGQILKKFENFWLLIFFWFHNNCNSKTFFVKKSHNQNLQASRRFFLHLAKNIFHRVTVLQKSLKTSLKFLVPLFFFE